LKDIPSWGISMDSGRCSAKPTRIVVSFCMKSGEQLQTIPL
jgi:hypothetical protein